jgi:hypothetical protein
MTISQRELDPYEAQLRSDSSRTREIAAEQLSDYLEYGGLLLESRKKIGDWLLDALCKENDELVIESLLNALGWINFNAPCPDINWRRLGEYLPRLPLALLGEYALTTLGESGDPAMIRYVQPYVDHADNDVRSYAVQATELLNSIAKTYEAEQMESPETWDLVTASLAVCDLSHPEFAWAFLVVQRLVRDGPNDRQTFTALLRIEEDKGPITGPTLAARVSTVLSTRGITNSPCNVADPNAKIANERIQTVFSWSAGKGDSR